MPTTTDYMEWRQGIKDDLKKIADHLAAAVEKAGKAAFAYVQNSSRVRTGSFKSNWNFSVDEPNLFFADRRVMRQKATNLRLASSKMNEFRERRAARRDMFMVNASPYSGILDRKDDYLGKAEAKFFEQIDKLAG
jgi:hypothetical protein